MKPNFALGLTDDGITLWHRSGDGWLRVGAVALDTADMDNAMADILAKAHMLAPDGITTKLVVPSEHLLLTQVHAPGPGASAQQSQIRAALAGRTPYPAEELVFDWSGAGSDVAVVVTARETLLEAEDFAVAYGLNPLCWVAGVTAPGFRGEPFLGLTRDARQRGLTLERLTRDPAIVRETGIARMPAPKPQAPKVEISAPAAAPTPAPVAPTEPVVTPKVETADVAAPSAPASAADAPPIVVKDAPESPAKPEEREAPTPSKADEVPPASVGFRSVRQPDAAGAKSAMPRATATPKPATPTTPAVPANTAKKTGAPAAALAVSQLGESLKDRYSKKSAALSARLGSSLGNLRKVLPGPKDGGSATADLSTDATLARLRALPDSLKAKSAPAEKLSKISNPLDTSRKVQMPATKPADTPEATDEASRMTIFGARGQTEDAPGVPRRALLIAGGALLVLVAAAIWALYFTSRPSDVAQNTPTAPQDSPAIVSPAPLPEDIAEAASATEPDDLAAIEQALAAEDAAQAERPIEDNADVAAADDESALPVSPAPASPVDTGTAEMGAAADAAADVPQVPVDESLAGRLAEIRSNQIELPEDLSGALVAPSPPAPFGAEPLPPVRGSEVAQAVRDAVSEAVETPSEAPASRFPGFDLGTQIAPGEEGLEINVTAGRPPSRPPAKPAQYSQPEAPAPQQDSGLPAPSTETQNAAASPAASTSEDMLAIAVVQALPPVVPPSFATPEVPAAADAPVLTEEDVVTAQSAPPALPPARAASAQPLPTDAPSADLQPEAAPLVDEQNLSIRVTDGRPDLTPPQRASAMPPLQLAAFAAPATDGADAPDPVVDANAVTLPPPGGVMLTALMRPAPRPSDLSRTSPDAPAADAGPDFSGATPQAVASSLRPSPRPARFAQTVQRALAAATPRATPAAPPASVPEPVQTASAAAAAMPSLPTATSVAREATQSRAINLRQVNLLGVMGTNSNRRALVRLSNGRVVTVRVGERFDDGQVTAIGDNELRYNRRGRDVVLRIAS